MTRSITIDRVEKVENTTPWRPSGRPSTVLVSNESTRPTGTVISLSLRNVSEGGVPRKRTSTVTSWSEALNTRYCSFTPAAFSPSAK